MISKQQIVNFIKAQPADRPVNMQEAGSSCECGCIMVHYGKEVLGLKEVFFCGRTIIGPKDQLDTDIGDIIPMWMWGGITTYGDIQVWIDAGT
jgi:hypothetical protein